MADAVTTSPDEGNHDSWAEETQALGDSAHVNAEATNGAASADESSFALGQDSEQAGSDYPSGDHSNLPPMPAGRQQHQQSQEKQMKPNKVYIGGLPEHTRQEDLQNCFGKIGTIVNIELKVGYGFVEFETMDAASESVAKYNEGFFMGNKIRVEISHGGGRTAAYSREPGACFRCGQMGHWARECPNHPTPGSGNPSRRDSLIPDRLDKQQRYPTPPRDMIPRDARYDYPPPPMPRDYRRPMSPPRDYRDYGAPRPRDYDDYRRVPPPDRYGPVPPVDYRGGGRYPEPPYRGYPPPAPPSYGYDRYDRRPSERYGQYVPPMAGGRPRSPPRSVYRDEYAPRAPDFPPDFRGRASPPPSVPPGRYPPNYTRGMSRDAEPRYNASRRSASPPASGSYDAYMPNVPSAYPGDYPGAAPTGEYLASTGVENGAANGYGRRA